MILDLWAQRWGIRADALLELKMLCGADSAPAIGQGEGSESRQQSLIRLEAPKHGVWLTRNNVGVLLDVTGRPVRYGACNESAAQNKVIKSGDLLGIDSVIVTPQMVGTTVGIFASIEVKHEGWKFNPNDKHEAAQLNWINFVNAKGGRATFASGPEIFTTGAWK